MQPFFASFSSKLRMSGCSFLDFVHLWFKSSFAFPSDSMNIWTKFKVENFGGRRGEA